MTIKHTPGQGRKKKPTALKIAEGNRSRRKLEPEKEPQLESEIPDIPEFLNQHAKKEWERITGHLYAHGLLTKIDRSALVFYCQCWGRYVELETQMKDEPLLDTDLMGKVKKNAKLPLIWAEMQNVWKYLNAFGMTPSARSGLHVEKKQDDHDLWAQFAEMTKARKEALKK